MFLATHNLPLTSLRSHSVHSYVRRWRAPCFCEGQINTSLGRHSRCSRGSWCSEGNLGYYVRGAPCPSDLFSDSERAHGSSEQQFRTIHEQSAKIYAFGPSVVSTMVKKQALYTLTLVCPWSILQEHATAQLDALRKDIDQHNTTQRNRMVEIKQLVRTELKGQAEKHLQYEYNLHLSGGCGANWNRRPHIQAEIRKMLGHQVQESVRAQIGDHIPIALDAQAREVAGTVESMRQALANS